MRARRPARRRRDAAGRRSFGETKYNFRLQGIRFGFRTMPAGGRAGPWERPRPGCRRKIAILLYFNGLCRKSREKTGRKPARRRAKAGEKQGRFAARNRPPGRVVVRLSPLRFDAPGRADMPFRRDGGAMPMFGVFPVSQSSVAKDRLAARVRSHCSRGRKSASGNGRVRFRRVGDRGGNSFSPAFRSGSGRSGRGRGVAGRRSLRDAARRPAQAGGGFRSWGI